MSTLYFDVNKVSNMSILDSKRALALVRAIAQAALALSSQPLGAFVGPDVLPLAWAEYDLVILHSVGHEVWKVHRICALRKGELIITFPTPPERPAPPRSEMN